MATPTTGGDSPSASDTGAKSRRIVIVLLVVALIPVTFVGGCLALAVVAGVLNYRDDAADRGRAASNPALQRPLSSSAGRILFTAQRDGTDDLYVVNVNGSGLAQITHNPSHSMLSKVALSPDRSRMAFSNARGVTITPVDRPAESTSLERPPGSLAWSPDGRQLASLSLDDQKRFHLFVYNVDGTGEARDIAAAWPPPAAGDEQYVSSLTWSPDGKRLAFVYRTAPAYKRSGPRLNQLYIVAVDRHELKNVSEDPNALWVEGGMAWAPDGQRLAFGSGRGIGVLDAELKWTEIPIAVHESRSEQLPSWSPDGTRIAWFSPDSIVTSDAAGEQRQELTRGRCRGVQPSWSPDGQRIAFVCYQDRSELFVMNVDGSGLTKVTTLDADKTWLDRTASMRNPIWLAAR